MPKRHWASANTPMQLCMPEWVAACWDQSQPVCVAEVAPSQSAAACPLAATADMPAQQEASHKDGFSLTTAGNAFLIGAGSNTASSCSSGGNTKGSSWAHDRVANCSAGFCTWANQLHPSKEERRIEKAIVKRVRRAALAACRGQPWGVAAVRAVGRFYKNTSLRNA